MRLHSQSSLLIRCGYLITASIKDSWFLLYRLFVSWFQRWCVWIYNKKFRNNRLKIDDFRIQITVHWLLVELSVLFTCDGVVLDVGGGTCGSSSSAAPPYWPEIFKGWFQVVKWLLLLLYLKFRFQIWNLTSWLDYHIHTFGLAAKLAYYLSLTGKLYHNASALRQDNV